MSNSRWILMATTVILGLQSLPTLPAVAAEELTPQTLLQRLAHPSHTQGFTGQRTLKVKRQNSNPLVATADISFADADNYDLHITGPDSIRGVDFNMKNGVNSAYFPEEQLFLTNGGKNTSYMPERIILGLFSPRVDLLQKNYDIHILAQDDAFASVSAYKVEFVPKNKTTTIKTGMRIPLVPRRIYWLEQNDLHVLKEERFWDNVKPDGSWDFTPEADAYSTAYYEVFKQTPKPLIPTINPGGPLNRVNLSGKEKNSFLTYATVAEAQAKEGIHISVPNYLPPGFAFKDIQVFTIFGARIQVLNYTDGLNDMMITIRPKQNAFVTLMAGAFSIPLIKKISDLSSQAPNNYLPKESDTQIAIVFGDLHPEELDRVGTSMNLVKP